MSERRAHLPSAAFGLTHFYLKNEARIAELTDPRRAPHALHEAQLKIDSLRPRDPYNVNTVAPDGRLEFALRLIKGIAKDEDPQTRKAASNLLTVVPIAPDHADIVREKYFEAVQEVFSAPDVNPRTNVRDMLEVGLTLSSSIAPDQEKQIEFIEKWRSYGETLEDQENWASVKQRLDSIIIVEPLKKTSDQLGERAKKMWEMRFIEQKGMAEIGVAFGVTASRVSTILGRMKDYNPETDVGPELSQEDLDACRAYKETKIAKNEDGSPKFRRMQWIPERRRLTELLRERGCHRIQIGYLLGEKEGTVGHDMKSIAEAKARERASLPQKADIYEAEVHDPLTQGITIDINTQERADTHWAGQGQLLWAQDETTYRDERDDTYRSR